MPYEFHVWPSVGRTAWAAIVTGDPSLLWPDDGWHLRDQPEPSTRPTAAIRRAASAVAGPPRGTGGRNFEYGPSKRAAHTAASSPLWRCSGFVSNIWKTGLDLNVWSFQGCTPRPGYTSVKVCIQEKHGWVFHWWKNLRCERRNKSGEDTGWVELEFATECRKGTHKYRGLAANYAYPPPGEGGAASLKQFKTKC